jgi:hypothetical protein
MLTMVRRRSGGVTGAKMTALSRPMACISITSERQRSGWVIWQERERERESAREEATTTTPPSGGGVSGWLLWGEGEREERARRRGSGAE